MPVFFLGKVAAISALSIQAIRTLLSIASVCNCCYPMMSHVTTPPVFFVAVCCHITGGIRSIFFIVPLRCNVRSHCRQARFLWNNSVLIAEWTSTSSYPVVRRGLPFVSFFTYPPDSAVMMWHDHTGTEVSIFIRMPLSRKFWCNRLQIIITYQNLMIVTYWATSSSGSVSDSCLPFMALFADSPNTFM